MRRLSVLTGSSLYCITQYASAALTCSPPLTDKRHAQDKVQGSDEEKKAAASKLAEINHGTPGALKCIMWWCGLLVGCGVQRMRCCLTKRNDVSMINTEKRV